LYGAIVVRDPAEDRDLGLPECDNVLVLDDILLDDNEEITDPFPTDPLENAATQLNGREGNVLLVNGRSGMTAKLRRGVPTRLRLLNVANARFMRVSIPGHRLWRIGGDGGLLEEPISIEPIDMIADPDDPAEMISNPDPSKGLLLTPGERADIVFTPTGKEIRLEWHDWARGRHTTFDTGTGIGVDHDHHDGKHHPITMLNIKLNGRQESVEWLPPLTLRDIEPIDTTGADTWPVMFGHTPPDANGDVVFFAQRPGMPWWMVTPADAHTATVGETKIWMVVNMTGGDHNFHTHGFHFQPLAVRYIDEAIGRDETVPWPYLEDKDTVLTPKRPGAFGSSRTITMLAVRFDETGREGQIEAVGKVPGPTTSGGWLFHCHLLEHTARGMMSFFQIEKP